MSEIYSMEFEEEQDDIEELKEEKMKTSKLKTKTRKKLDEDSSNFPSKSRLKGIMLSATKPSYTLKKAVGKSRFEFETLRWDNRNRLRYLLRQLVRQHNWDEASGVLSMLLKGTRNEKSITKNRSKYWATMELLKHMKGDSINPRKIQHVYELWMKKIGPMKNWPMKDKFAVQLEFILFCLMRGNLEDAHQAVIGLMQEREFGSDPTLNLVVGLTFCQLWYSNIRKQLPLGELDESLTPLKSETFQSGFFDQSIANSDAVQDADSPTRCDSNTSVRNDKENIVGDSLRQRKEYPTEADYDVKREIPLYQNVKTEGFYAIPSRSKEHEESSFVNNDAGDIPNASIFHARGLEPWLLPINFPHSNENLEDFLYLQRQVHNNDYYVGAVKHLRLALYCSPPLFEALLPLIQMLLLGDQVKEALEELEKVIHNSELALPLRVKARILEHFYGNNYSNISTCIENILKRDPTCTHSLSRLINFQHDGSYSIENLLEMIALHLDATKGDISTWKEFASCFLKISQSEQDCMSHCMNGDNNNNNYDGEKEKSLAHSNFIRIPEILVHGESGKNWRFRCRWWLTRHFSRNVLVSDITTGDFDLLTYKAAAASHLYGRENEYVVKACSNLVNDKNRDLLSLLQMHMENSVGLYTVFDKKN